LTGLGGSAGAYGGALGASHQLSLASALTYPYTVYVLPLYLCPPPSHSPTTSFYSYLFFAGLGGSAGAYGGALGASHQLSLASARLSAAAAALAALAAKAALAPLHAVHAALARDVVAFEVNPI